MFRRDDRSRRVAYCKQRRKLFPCEHFRFWTTFAFGPRSLRAYLTGFNLNFCHESDTGRNYFYVPIIESHPSGDFFGVAEYRAFPVGIDGHFIGFEPLVCDSDDEAIAKARRLVDGHDVELWCGERLVVRLTVKPRPNKI
jgi:hypothetical protein